MRKCLITLVSLMTAGPPALAATVSPQSGIVQVNTGSGFGQIHETAQVPPGTQIMVEPGGSALISYENCQVKVGAHQVWSVAAKSPCPSGKEFVDLTQRMGNTEGEPTTGINGTTILVGVGVAGAVAAAIALSNDDDDNGGGGGGSNSPSAQ